MVLRRMDQLKPIMSGAIRGTLTQSEFYQRNRDRKNVLVYRRNIEEYLTERGKEHRVPRFRRAFKLRRPRSIVFCEFHLFSFRISWL